MENDVRNKHKEYEMKSYLIAGISSGLYVERVVMAYSWEQAESDAQYKLGFSEIAYVQECG